MLAAERIRSQRFRIAVADWLAATGAIAKGMFDPDFIHSIGLGKTSIVDIAMPDYNLDASSNLSRLPVSYRT
jgi:hypothetical protein